MKMVVQSPDLSLYSLNAPLDWARGLTLLGIMSRQDMSTEIMVLLESTRGFIEVDVMDEKAATPLMRASPNSA